MLWLLPLKHACRCYSRLKGVASRQAIFAVLLFATGCNGLVGSNMPDPHDEVAVKRALFKLNPIAPGGQPREDGMYNLGQPGSDRYLFMQWVSRYDDIDAIRRDNIDYRPAPIPSSVAEAIKQERSAEDAQAAQDRADELRNRRHDEQQRQSEIEGDRRLEARLKAERDAADAQRATRDAEEAREQPGFDACNHERIQASGRAAANDNGETWRSFKCEERFPAASH